MSFSELSFLDGASNRFRESVQQAIETFVDDANSSPNKVSSDYSITSLKSLYQYSQFFNDFSYHVFVDFSSGFFGIALRCDETPGALLNLVFQENSEIIFSFMNQENGITKISGRATFSENYSDIFRLTKMLSD